MAAFFLTLSVLCEIVQLILMLYINKSAAVNRRTAKLTERRFCLDLH
jgi:hypothetical protein